MGHENVLLGMIFRPQGRSGQLEQAFDQLVDRRLDPGADVEKLVAGRTFQRRMFARATSVTWMKSYAWLPSPWMTGDSPRSMRSNTFMMTLT